MEPDYKKMYEELSKMIWETVILSPYDPTAPHRDIVQMFREIISLLDAKNEVKQ